MYLSWEDARSDFVLAAAAVMLGQYVASLIGAIPGYPDFASVPYLVLGIGWVALLAVGPSLWLARYRRDVPAAFATDQRSRGSLAPGLLLVAPLLVGHLLDAVLTGDLGTILLAFGGTFTLLGPTVGNFTLTVETALAMVAVAILAVGSWLFGSFLVVRARDAFRSPDADLTELVRTFGVGAVGVNLVLGLLVSVRDPRPLGDSLLLAAVLFAVVLVTDRFVPARVTTTRATVLGPLLAVVVLWILNFGGPFRGDLLLGLYSASAAGAVIVCAAAMIEIRQGLAAAMLLIASAVYPVSSIILQPMPLPILLP